MPRPLRPLTPDASPRHFLGALLREWRLKLRWSQLALGQRVGASASWISRIEKAERSAPADLLQRCDLVLGTGGLLARYGAAARVNTASGARSSGSATPTVFGGADLVTFGTPQLDNALPARRPLHSPIVPRPQRRGSECARAHEPGGRNRTLTADRLREASGEAASSAKRLGELVERMFGDVVRARSSGLADQEIARHLSVLGGPVAIRAALAADADGTAIRFLVASLVAVPQWQAGAGADQSYVITTHEEDDRA